VATIDLFAFGVQRPFHSISVESPGRLKWILSHAFALTNIQSLTIPRSVNLIDGFAFTNVSLDAVNLEPGNAVYRLEGGFLIDSVRQTMVCHFGRTATDIVVPRYARVLGSGCFGRHSRRPTITFERPSEVVQIEPRAFALCDLQSLTLPPSIRVIAPRAFSEVQVRSIEISRATPYVLVGDSLLVQNRLNRLVYTFSRANKIVIPRGVAILGRSCFQGVRSLHSVEFEEGSHLKRIEISAFACCGVRSFVIPRSVTTIEEHPFQTATLINLSIESGNQNFVIENHCLIDVVHHRLIQCWTASSPVVVPRSVEILGPACFQSGNDYFYRCCSSITFEDPSRLRRIEREVFDETYGTFLLPPNVSFLANDAVADSYQVALTEGDDCPEFGRWQKLHARGIKTDFRRIRRVSDLSTFVVDLSDYENKWENGEIYCRSSDGVLIVLKAIDLPDAYDRLAVESSILSISGIRALRLHLVSFCLKIRRNCGQSGSSSRARR
jgi:hypothetical protein